MDLPTERPSHPWQQTPALLFLALVLVAGAAFLGGVWFAHADESPRDDQDFRLFWQSWDILADHFYYDLPENRQLVYGAIEGLFSQADDPYTFFVPPRTAEIDRQKISGQFGGIGAYVSQNQSGAIVIAAPFEGFPAQQAGLQAEDVIVAVDGASLAGHTLEDAVALLRGEIGTQVTLAIYRPATAAQFEVEITRARVELPTAYSQPFGEAGYVRLFSFNGLAAETLAREIQKLLDGGAKALILDLRDNPGGLLDQAVAVSDLFLGDGVIVTQRNRAGGDIVYRADDGDLAESIPLVVLVNGGSASASEVVAGALHDRGRAALIGQTTFGKGLVQQVYDMPGGSQVHVTTALWFTPDDTQIQGVGLTPDLAVPPDAASADEDPFVAAALHALAERGVIVAPVPTPESEQP